LRKKAYSPLPPREIRRNAGESIPKRALEEKSGKERDSMLGKKKNASLRKKRPSRSRGKKSGPERKRGRKKDRRERCHRCTMEKNSRCARKKNNAKRRKPANIKIASFSIKATGRCGGGPWTFEKKKNPTIFPLKGSSANDRQGAPTGKTSPCLIWGAARPPKKKQHPRKKTPADRGGNWCPIRMKRGE